MKTIEEPNGAGGASADHPIDAGPYGTRLFPGQPMRQAAPVDIEAQLDREFGPVEQLAATLKRERIEGPRYPAGTPEHAAYLAELRVELAKFSTGEDPYPYGAEFRAHRDSLMDTADRWSDPDTADSIQFANEGDNC